MTERLNRFLARAGVASRRAADRLIVEGRVRVNGTVIRELGSRVDGQRDAVKVDGKRVAPATRGHTYLMLHKPRDVVTTMSDPEGRTTVRDLLRGVRARVFPVGRLDYHSEGLLLLTDDGELARRLMHPSSGVTKTYRAKVRGIPEPASLQRLASGIALDGRRTIRARVTLVRSGANASWVELELVEGRRRQVRRMLGSVGHPVQRLRRVRYGGVGLGSLPLGRVRPLTAREVERLREAAGLRPEASPRN